ncbi:hypothetical protein JCM10450v2_003917 [Rhodotorula kratochvilovae]
MSADSSPIPLIDLTVRPSPSDLGAQVLKAASAIGFLFLRLPQDGGLSQARVNQLFGIAKELFDSPLEERQACANDEDRNGHIGFGKNRLAESVGAGDLKENFTYGRHPEHIPSTRQPLPPVLAAHRAELDAFHGACWNLTCELLDAFSVALKLPQSYLRERHAQGCNGLTLINYPAIAPGRAADAAAQAATSRASEHKDWGSLTLLFQEENGTPGLEVFLPDELVAASRADKALELMADVDLTRGKWHAAPVIPGTVLVNVGLAVEAWTSGVLRATLHRVIVQPGADGGFRARRSMPYFVQPRDQVRRASPQKEHELTRREKVVLNPIRPDGSIDESGGARTSVEFFRERIGASFKATQAQVEVPAPVEVAATA